MKEKRSFLQKLFNVRPRIVENTTQLQLLNGYNSIYTGIGDKEYDQKVARQCIDRIATHVAKLQPHHIKSITSQIMDSQIGYLLENRPNPIMNTYDFLYKVTSNLYSNKNAFIYIHRDKLGIVQGFYPLNAVSEQLYEDENGTIYLQFQFMNGKMYMLPYLELIHLRLFYNQNDIFGTLDNVLKTDLETTHVASEGIKNAIRTSTTLKGILKFTNAMLKEKDIVASKEKFVKDYINLENESGIASLDGKAEFQEVNMKPITLDADQLKMVNYNIYDYFGISEDIVKSDFKVEQWNAFYESVVEPRAIQMGLEFTNKLFNKKAIKEGHKIMFSTNKLMYANLNDKVNLIKNTSAYGYLRVDEAREVLGLPPLRRNRRTKNITIFELYQYTNCR